MRPFSEWYSFWVIVWVLAFLGGAGDSLAQGGPRAYPTTKIQQLKAVERSAGFKPTGNFARSDPRITAYYRCYYTAKLELPESYNGLKLREGTQQGCALDEKKYDVFFYPVEAVASGQAPVTQSLAEASTDRLAMVVPHEDFHDQVRRLPDLIGEAAATLIGFVTAATAFDKQALDADLFLRKAEIVNRYFDRLRETYKSAREGAISHDTAREEQQRLLITLQQECAAIEPNPASFNKCLPVANNAGLAFDHSYTKYYPLLYRVYVNCGKELRCAAQKILSAPRKSEPEVARYLAGM
jgi:hypothetical protein